MQVMISTKSVERERERERERRESAAMLGINTTLEKELRTMACMTQCSISYIGG
jgi:hypothetical protein